MDSFNLLEISGKSVLYQNLLPLANLEYLDVQIQLYPMFREQGVTSAIPPFTIMYGWRWGSSLLKYLSPSQARWRVSLGLIFRTLSSVLMPKLSLTLKTESCLTFHFLNTWQSLSKPKVTILLGLSGTQAEQLHFLCKTSRQIFRIVWPTLLIVSVRSSLSRLSELWHNMIRVLFFLLSVKKGLWRFYVLLLHGEVVW